MTPREVEAFIRAHLPPAPAPGAPEIVLHLATPTSGLHRLAAADPTGFASPYWAYPWAGGLALVQHLRAQPEIVRGRRVLDLGAGSGLVAIAAAQAGASAVSAAETDAYARVALALNAQVNGVALAILAEDVTAGPAPASVDVVLVGDLFYAPDLAVRVLAFLHRCTAAGMDVLIGDPRRAPLPHAALQGVATYAVGDFGGPVQAGVYRLRV